MRARRRRSSTCSPAGSTRCSIRHRLLSSTFAPGGFVRWGVTGKVSLPVLPDVPVVADDLPGYEAGSWFGLCAPRGTPKERIDTLNTAANNALRDRALQSRLNELGAQAMPGSNQ